MCVCVFYKMSCDSVDSLMLKYNNSLEDIFIYDEFELKYNDKDKWYLVGLLNDMYMNKIINLYPKDTDLSQCGMMGYFWIIKLYDIDVLKIYHNQLKNIVIKVNPNGNKNIENIKNFLIELNCLH